MCLEYLCREQKQYKSPAPIASIRLNLATSSYDAPTIRPFNAANQFLESLRFGMHCFNNTVDVWLF